MEIYNENITKLKGIGPGNEKLLNSIGISTVGELMHNFTKGNDIYKYYENHEYIR